jgi:hypothetical protein
LLRDAYNDGERRQGFQAGKGKAGRKSGDLVHRISFIFAND